MILKAQERRKNVDITQKNTTEERIYEYYTRRFIINGTFAWSDIDTKW